jgi:crotonobetainyl-CoA:carnitine CoA-transferase CaiB-like acyl-CoA transferase
MLSAMGAEITRLEPPGLGDYSRFIGAPIGDVSALFHVINRGKRSIALDLKRPEGQEVALRLVAQSDVVVEQFRPGVMGRLGLDYAALKGAREDIIMCSLTGYGQTGPLAKSAGHDLNYQALSGLLWLGGDPGGPPPVPAIPFGDMYGAQSVVTGVVAALFARERGLGGQHLDISMAGCMATAGAPMLAGYTAAGAGALGRGGDILSGGIAQYAVYEASCGGYLAVAALEPKFFALFADRVGRPEWKAESPLPGPHQPALKAAIGDLIATKSRDEWVDLLAGDDCCVSAVLDPFESGRHPHWAAQGLAISVSTDQGVASWVEPALGTTPEGPPPALGADSDAVLRGAGFSDPQIAELRSSGVVA